jgi:hypothetical protein
MKTFCSPAKTIAMLMATAAGLIMAAESSAIAQPRPSSIQRRVEQLNRQGEQYERDNPDRDAAGGPNRKDRSESTALMARVRKDLEGLQANYNHIVIEMASRKTLPDNQILKAVTEIRDRSMRLKHDLALPQPKDEERKAPLNSAASDQGDAVLMALREHIYRFLMNPIFEAPAVLDVEHGKKASRDLDKIIEISDNISRHYVKKQASH